MDRTERSGIVHDACARAWRDSGEDLAVPHGDGRLVLLRQPGLIVDREDRVVGVDAWVRLYDPTGREVKVDNHRRIINPPTVHHEDGGDPYAAWLQVLKDSVAGTPNRRGWRRDGSGGTVDTFFSSTADGLITSSDPTYTTARSGGTFSVSTSATSHSVGQRNFLGSSDCYETFVSWDTSSIADGDAVSAVTLDMWLVSDTSTGAEFTVEARDYDWSTSVTSADWVAGANLGNYTLCASIGTSGIGSTGAYKTFTSQAAFLTVTNLKTGTVHLILASDRLRQGNAPSTNTNEYVDFSFADTAGTTQDPKLTVTHAAAKGAPFSTSSPLRIWKVRRH